MDTKITAALLIFVIVLSACQANLIQDVFGSIFGVQNEKRSLSDAISEYLDMLYPKDDVETKMMKTIFEMLSEEGHDAESALDALEQLGE